MNKKQEALRRGLRSFIEDTSRELADLEGRPLRRPPHAAGPATLATADPAVGGRDAQAERGPARVTPEGATPEISDQRSPRRDIQDGAGAQPRPTGATTHPGIVHRPAGATAEPDITHPPAASHAPASAVLEADPSPRGRESEPGGRVAAPEAPARPRREASAAPVHAETPPRVETPRRRPKAPVRRRPRPAAEISANGISPAQAYAKKGVCFAYFVNHECWRVPDAYCISALQVCITRECPVYHLHKDALEHRFARKFKHFW